MRTVTFSAERAAASACLLLACWFVWTAAAYAGESCIRDPHVVAVDLSAPVNQGFLDRMRGIGIGTIIRYYDHEDETLPGKTLRRWERDAIIMNGFKMGVVFQHRNDRFASFTPLRGRQDAERSLGLAAENAQPKGSAIYFGVDGPWKSPSELIGIMAYFREINTRLPAAGYRVGVYGSGLVCNTLLANGLAELCWLAAPTAWPAFSTFYPTRKWRLVQLPTSQCGGRSVDFNLANGADSDYGQFGH